MPELVCDIHLEKLAENIQKYSKIEERKYRENDMHVNDDSHSSDSRPTSDNEVSSSSDRNNDEPSVRRKRKSVENMCHEREHHGDHLQMQVASVIASNLGPMVEIVEKKLLQHKNAEKLLNDGREVFIKTLEEHNQKKEKVERKAKLVAIPPMKARNRRSSRNSLVYIDGPSTSESHSSMVQQVPIIDNIPEVLENETAVCSISSEADHNSRGIKDNQEFAIEISGEVSRTDDICDDFAVFLKKCTVLLTKFIDSYYDFRSTMKLKPEDAIEHWSAERLTKEEHAARVTRFDVAIARATRVQYNIDIKLLTKQSFVFDDDREAAINKRLARIERFVNEQHEEINWFCFSNFSLMDIGETKDRYCLGDFYDKAISMIPKVKDVPSVVQLAKECKMWSAFERILKQYNFEPLKVFEELQKMLEKDYFLPKGKIFCQFLLNVAQLFSYDVVKNEWSCIKQIDGTLFSGVPFDRDGNLLPTSQNSPTECSS
ncbi:ULP_PROTEASE domain-containing protein [Caenorhabditis elegans]|nr:ULP_PROTEASE domain-containing protein [Caenorhabditis elegans]CCD66779.1 ULP_PROTEASE domain-containing protein [Caenorhabditis elegans]|eukprot:NP_498010.2 Uncharacterized protein CELE_C35D10.7 [Caenorhabditis elegans]